MQTSLESQDLKAADKPVNTECSERKQPLVVEKRASAAENAKSGCKQGLIGQPPRLADFELEFNWSFLSVIFGECHIVNLHKTPNEENNPQLRNQIGGGASRSET